VGDIGGHAERFIRALADMRQTWWQMLPIGPTGYADSPYQSPSTFAGNPLLISLDLLVEEGLLDPVDLADAPRFSTDHVDFGSVIPWRSALMAEATARLLRGVDDGLLDEKVRFENLHAGVWLDDFALYTAIKRANRLAPWWEWEESLALRDPVALRTAGHALSDSVDRVKAEQFLFDRHFRRLHRRAAEAGIKLIGDIPIFVAHDSADVWANRRLFHLDESGMPTVVAGVPPDYFSLTGQRWGNPLYDWDRHQEEGFSWWTQRMRRVFTLFDLVRVDHFRGFLASWHIPADEETAVIGEWVEAPGAELFDHLRSAFDDLPVIAEDLGVITPDVEELRDRYGFPGMKVLQFGFGTESAHALPEFRPNVVAYTGTHDNNTALGWFEDTDPDRIPERATALETLGSDGTEFHWDLIGGVMESVADTAIVPLQDLLGLGSTSRMNTPGTVAGNWRWRLRWPELSADIVRRMCALTEATGRAR
jgi:4-alpha-glucanotransferase